MNFETVKSKVSAWYGDFPGPDEDAFKYAVAISESMSKSAIKESGVIGCAKSTGGWWYVALSAPRKKPSRRCKLIAISMEAITVVEHPHGNNSETLTAHIGGGDADRAYIAPCATCKSVFSTYFPKAIAS